MLLQKTFLPRLKQPIKNGDWIILQNCLSVAGEAGTHLK
jgi:hypothetical protein